MENSGAVHLYNLALFNPLSAILSNHAVRVDSLAYENGINMPVGITHCSNCSVLQIPGLTSSSRITYTKKSKTFRKRHYQVKCLVCHHMASKGALLDKKVAGNAPDVRTERKKKKKRSELASMIATKKEQNTKKTLSLFAFMQ